MIQQAYQCVLSAISSNCERQVLTVKQLNQAIVEEFSLVELEKLDSEPYYYGSTEGPFDYIIDQMVTFGIISWSGITFVLGPNATPYMV